MKISLLHIITKRFVSFNNQQVLKVIIEFEHPKSKFCFEILIMRKITPIIGNSLHSQVATQPFAVPCDFQGSPTSESTQSAGSSH